MNRIDYTNEINFINKSINEFIENGSTYAQQSYIHLLSFYI